VQLGMDASDAVTDPTSDALADVPQDMNQDVPPDVTPAPPGYLGTAEAVKACSWIFSCPKLARSLGESIGVPVDSSNFSLCVDWCAGPVDPTRVGFPTQASVLKCISQAASCGQAGQCVAFEYLTLDDARCADAAVPDAGTYTQFCGDDGGAVVYCSPSYDNMVIHCGTGNYDSKSKCILGTSGAYACAVDKSCPGPTCDSTFFYDTCSSGKDLHMRVNCSATGKTCGQDDAGYIGCIVGENFEECNLYAVKCVGSKVRVCDSYNQSYFDCAEVGGTCSAKLGMPRCTRPSESCDPSDANTVTCAGNNLSLCVGGKTISFDCSSVGLACKPGQLPLSATCG
jgi:hypothetical protein